MGDSRIAPDRSGSPRGVARAGRKKRRKERKGTKTAPQRFLTGVALSLGVLLVGLLAAGGYLAFLSTRLPDLEADPDAIHAAETSVVYAADGSVLAEWYDAEDRTIVDSSAIPATLKNATVAIEDKRFYLHDGVDLQGIARAFMANTEAGEIRQGGSTITQQTVKMLFTDGKRTYTRKIEEALLAILLESRAEKDEVLSVYLNTVYFGRGAYGVESAARRFFGSSTEELTLGQSALLAGCIQSPTRYDPFSNPEDSLGRRNVVLSEMLDQGYITDAEYARVVEEPLGLKESSTQAAQFAPYFLEYVRRDLLERLGSEALYRGGLRIYTTLDPAVQTAAEAAARSVLPDPADPEVAIAAVRWSDGAVVAIVGGRDFSAQQFDLATQGKRQTGSAFKPFVLIAALENGYTLDSLWDASPFDTPVKDEIWHVENYENNITGGQYTLEQATIWSINTVYARLIVAVGPEKVVDVAQRMGITTPMDPDPAIALGGLKNGASPLEMASAFGTIANNGVAIEPSAIEKVTDDKGALVYQPNRAGTQAISEGIAAAVGAVLNKVYTSGTGAAANFGQWSAVKTGTSQSWSDAWMVGYSGDLSTAVWVGRPEAQIPMEDVHGIRVTGGSYPAQAWKAFMEVASVEGAVASVVVGEDGEDIVVPEGYAVYNLCPESRMLARPDCPNALELMLPIGSVTDEVCTLKH
ncbi:MAG: PBP1A family penicillin-binding protein [Coriobacteriia bacterium]|nr:PBP1A family penicillin-binding protein [Coriobacteriia bacterium]